MKIQKLLAASAVFLLIPAHFICAQIVIPQTPLKSDIEGNIIIARLMDGDSLFSKITQIVQQYSISSGVILFDIGQLRDFSIGQYNPVSRRYVSQTYKLPWELVSLQGTIANGSNSGGLQLNCQATLADSTGGTIAGHLTKGVVSVINEIVILKLQEMSLFRAYNAKSGLWELDINPR